MRHYAIASIGCAVFALIYAQFSHGVHSPFMTFMFAIPWWAARSSQLPTALRTHIHHVGRASHGRWR